MIKHDPLHLFLYHKDDAATRSNYDQLVEFEGLERVQPISDCQSSLKNTFRADRGKWQFPHWDSYWMCDGLIYKYVLENKDRVLDSSVVCINEWDTFWQMNSDGWMPELMQKNDIAASNVLKFGRDGWVFFDKHKHLDFSASLMGLVPFSVVCVKPQLMVEIAERVRDDKRFHPLYNNEMRIGTAANICGARIGTLPHNVGRNVQWHHCNYSQAPGIYHPVKKTLPAVHSSQDRSRKIIASKSTNKSKGGRGEFAVITAALYGDPARCFEASKRLRASVERFDRELVVVDGPAPPTMQEMKNHLIVPKLEEMDHEWVMWLDCSDVYCAQDPYLAIKYAKKCGKQILVSAEGNCWPEPHLSSRFPDPPFAFKGIDYRFLCAGVCMGKRKDFIKHMKIMQDMYSSQPELMEPWRTDQATWHRLFLDQNKLGASVALDYSCDFVVSTCNVPMSNFSQGARGGMPCVKINPTGGKPIILHFNGNDKHDTKKIESLIGMTDQTGFMERLSTGYSAKKQEQKFSRKIIKVSDSSHNAHDQDSPKKNIVIRDINGSKTPAQKTFGRKITKL